MTHTKKDYKTLVGNKSAVRITATFPFCTECNGQHCLARPWTPELRAEREALSLIHFLRDQGQPQSEWLNALSSDQTLSEPVRQRALQFAREWK